MKLLKSISALAMVAGLTAAVYQFLSFVLIVGTGHKQPGRQGQGRKESQRFHMQ